MAVCAQKCVADAGRVMPSQPPGLGRHHRRGSGLPQARVYLGMAETKPELQYISSY